LDGPRAALRDAAQQVHLNQGMSKRCFMLSQCCAVR
jgi:hypothetical protein